MASMKNYISTYILFGLVANTFGQDSNIHDDVMKTCEKYLSSTGRFLDKLSTLPSKMHEKFMIQSCAGRDIHESIMEIFRSDCSDADVSVIADASVCHFQALLGNFKANLSITDGLIIENLECSSNTKAVGISLGVTSSKSSEPFVTVFCEKLISSIYSQIREFNPCPTCPTSTLSICDTACNNFRTKTRATTTTTTATIPTTSATLTTISTPQTSTASPPPSTTTTTPRTTTSTTETTNAHHIDSRLDQERAKDCITASTLVIASISSFVAGIFCMMIIVFAIRFYRSRHQSSDSGKEGVCASDAQLNTKADESYEDKMKRGEMTYESLTKKESGADMSTDHVYLGLQTNSDSNKQPVVTYRYDNVSQADVDGKPKNIIEKTEDHVYNAIDLNSQIGNTYTGLNGRDNVKTQPLRESQKNSGTQNRSSEAHYFILHDETNGNRSGERNVFDGNVQEQEELRILENKVDSRNQSENDYFILEKVEHSDGSSHELPQNNETSADEQEGACHILEKE